MEFSTLPAPEAASSTRLRVAQGVVLLFHVTGFVGLAFSKDKQFFLSYTPLTLLLTAGLLLAFQPGRNLAFWLFGFQVFMLGFAAELMGTTTGKIFGHYTYGSTLGYGIGLAPDLPQVPLLIGLNWVVVTYLAGTLAAYLPVAWWVRVLVGAGLMVGFDLCLEPAAGALNFWHWAGDLIPQKNFRDWLLLSLVLQVLFVRSDFEKRNPLVPLVYLVQLLFFFLLDFVRM